MFHHKSLSGWNYILPLLWLGVLLWIDLWTKYFFYNLGLYKELSLIEPAMNMGISFSWAVPYIIIIPLSLWALVWFSYLYHKRSFSKIVTLCLMAGTLGNMYDRVIYGGVRDFLVMPGMFIFNVADILLSVGMIFALYHMFTHPQEKKM